MKSSAKTIAFVLVAVGLAAAAGISTPPAPKPSEFSDVGEPFYPGFTDPLKAASLEVIDYDDKSGTARPFKVEVKNGVWSIPSHYNYLADGKERLAKSAASVIDLRKDLVRSDRSQDHEALGVIDPLEETPSLKGRGQRVTLRDEGGAVLADFIIGKPVEGKDKFRYVRLPDKKRTYSVKVDIDLSTKFADWIETNLLSLTSSDVTDVDIADYSVDESTGMVKEEGDVRLSKGADNKWAMEGLPPDKKLDDGKVNTLTSALSRITITGVRPKPETLSHDLRTKEGLSLDPLMQMSLQQKGFFVSRDGRLLSNEGEVSVGTKDGVRYTLRFGEVLFGEGLEVSAGGESESADSNEKEKKKTEGAAENRYLFVTCSYDESLLSTKPAPPEGYQKEGEQPATTSAPADATSNGSPEAASQPADDPVKKAAAEKYEKDLKDWLDKAEKGRKKSEELNNRFAAWYYVISGADFQNIRVNRDKLIKEEPKTEKKPGLDE